MNLLITKSGGVWLINNRRYVDLCGPEKDLFEELLQDVKSDTVFTINRVKCNLKQYNYKFKNHEDSDNGSQA